MHYMCISEWPVPHAASKLCDLPDSLPLLEWEGAWFDKPYGALHRCRFGRSISGRDQQFGRVTVQQRTFYFDDPPYLAQVMVRGVVLHNRNVLNTLDT